MHARMTRRSTVVLGAIVAFAMFGGAHAWATSITEPRGGPVVAPVDAAGHLAPITVSATGFPERTAVYVEQCDGTSPTMLRWSPTEHCDLGSSPAAVYADANGNVTFAASDPKHAFVPFVGESPQSLFNCLPSGGAAPNNGLPNFTNCQVRVSSNDADVTLDQQFFGLRLPANATNPPPRTTTTTLPRRGSKPASTHVTTTTRASSVSSRARSQPGPGANSHNGSTTTAPASGTRGAPAAAARPPTKAGSTDSPGLLGLSDAAVVASYLVLLLGVAVAALSVRRARSRAIARRSPPEPSP